MAQSLKTYQTNLNENQMKVGFVPGEEATIR